MQDIMYNMGGAAFWVVVMLIVLFCINKIRKNRAEIKRLEQEIERNKKWYSGFAVQSLLLFGCFMVAYMTDDSSYAVQVQNDQIIININAK